MNFKNISKGLLLGASLFLATAAFAGEKASVKLYENVKLNGKSLAPGEYDLEWTGTGPDVQLNIRKGKVTVVSAAAKITPVASASTGTGYSTKPDTDGTKSLTSVFLAGKKYTIELGAEVATTPAKATEPAGNR
ncbi:MAG TPA: hypothetical protein VKP58_05430 [Candidatus Acidoferrum sp.]|nr:hypothetical protein [Candidatus Acidoferrum sp.]